MLRGWVDSVIVRLILLLLLLSSFFLFFLLFSFSVFLLFFFLYCVYYCVVEVLVVVFVCLYVCLFVFNPCCRPILSSWRINVYIMFFTRSLWAGAMRSCYYASKCPYKCRHIVTKSGTTVDLGNVQLFGVQIFSISFPKNFYAQLNFCVGIAINGT